MRGQGSIEEMPEILFVNIHFILFVVTGWQNPNDFNLVGKPGNKVAYKQSHWKKFHTQWRPKIKTGRLLQTFKKIDFSLFCLSSIWMPKALQWTYVIDQYQ